MSDAGHRSIVVGAGPMGRQHARIIRSMEPELGRLVAIVDADPEAADSLEDGLSDIPFYSDLAVAVAAEEADIVHVCTPMHTHVALAKSAMELGAHVYVEKPFAPSPDEARSLFETADRQNVRICAGHQLLRQRLTLEGTRLAREIGTLHHVRSFFAFRPPTDEYGSPRRPQADQLLDILPHPTCLLLHFLSGGNPSAPVEVEEVETDPCGDVHALVSVDGRVGSLVVTLTGRPVDSRVELIGSRGSVTLDYVRDMAVSSPPASSTVGKVFAPYRTAVATAVGATIGLARRLRGGGSYPGLREAITGFYHHVDGAGPNPVSRWNVQATTAVQSAVREKMDAHPELQAGRDSIAIQSVEGGVSVRPDVVVTGGTGLLGRRVVEALVDQGRTPCILARRIPPPDLRIRGAVYTVGDLGRPDTFDLPAGAEVVIHCAAETKGGWKAHERNSIAATRHLIEKMEEKRIPRLVHVSSLAVVSIRASEPIDEGSPLEEDPLARGPYVHGKLESERLAVIEAGKREIAIRVVRPAALVDPDSYEPPGKLGRRLGPLFVAVGESDESMPICTTTLAARAITKIVDEFDGSPEVVHLLEAELPTRMDLLEMAKAETGARRSVWIGPRLLRSISNAAVLAQRAIRPGRPPLNVASAFEVCRYDTRGIQDLLNPSEPETETPTRADETPVPAQESRPGVPA